MDKRVDSGAPRKLPPSRLRTQADTCMEILSETLEAVLGNSVPADQFLAARFRKDRRLGSRDRRLISWAVFSVFRQYGFLRAAFGVWCANSPDRQRVLSLYILGAALLESFLPETHPHHLEHARLAEDAFLRLFETQDELERFRRFAALAGSEYSPDITHILPEWALPELVHPLDRRFYQIQRTRPPMWIRAQTDRIDFLLKSLAEAGLAADRHPALPDAFSIADAHVNLHTVEAYRKGLFELQDISSQCIGRACMPSRGETWWDVCSGGGGKALQLASLLHRTGVVTATDIRTRKLVELKKRTASCGSLGAFLYERTAEFLGNDPTIQKVIWDIAAIACFDCPEAVHSRIISAPVLNPDASWTLTEERHKIRLVHYLERGRIFNRLFERLESFARS